MGMTIEQIIKYLPAPICCDTILGNEKQKEYDAYDSAVIILRKYQKIEEIYKNWSYGADSCDCMKDIERVIEDGKIDS